MQNSFGVATGSGVDESSVRICALSLQEVGVLQYCTYRALIGDTFELAIITEIFFFYMDIQLLFHSFLKGPLFSLSIAITFAIIS